MYTNLTVSELDQRLNLTAPEAEAALRRHLVFGAPEVAPEVGLSDEQVCELAQTEYATGYNNRTRLPRWVAFTLRGTVSGACVCVCVCACVPSGAFDG